MGDGIGHGGVQRREEICGDGGTDGEDLIAGSGVLAVVGKVGRGIADAGEGRFAGLAVFGEREVQHDTVAAVCGDGGVHRGIEIAEAVGDEAGLVLAGVGGDGAGLHRADNMRMGTDDGVDAAGEEEICDALLRGGDGAVGLAAPVEHGEDDVGLEGVGRVERAVDGVSRDLIKIGRVVGIEQIDRVLRAVRQAETAETLRITEDGHAESGDIAEQDAFVCRFVAACSIGADMVDAGGV